MAVEQVDKQGSEKGDRQLYRSVLYVEHNGCPNADVTAEYNDVRITSISGALEKSGDRKKQLLRIRADDTPLSEFVDAYRDHERVLDVTEFPCEDTDDMTYISVTIDYSDMKSVSETLTEHGIYREPSATALAGGERWCLYLDSHATLSAIVDLLEGRGYPVTVRKKDRIDLGEARTPSSLLAKADMTARQREVFLAAVSNGYFEVGSDTNLEDVAAELDISTSAVWEHLSRAKEKILTSAANEAFENDQY